jgi:glycosyltransferase involved in cell wall biosynthesis
MLPLVSVITPTYNRPEYLTEALKSGLNQTYKNIEIIVSDNCSPENPLTLVESFNDERIRFSRNEKNLGMIANTIKTFCLAKGKYVACLLDDDMWEPDFLEKLVPHLEANPNLALAFSDHSVMRADGSIDHIATKHYSQFYQRANLKEGIYQPFYHLALVDKAVSPAMAAVIRRDVIDWDSFPQGVEGSWDMFISYLASREGLGAYYYPEKLTRYREHDQTDTKQSGSRNAPSKIRKARGDLFCYEQFINDERLKDVRPYFQECRAHVSTTLGVGLMRDAKLSEARDYFWNALLEKFSLRTLAALIISFAPTSLATRF